MAVRFDLHHHFSDYHIYNFQDRRSYEAWAEQLLGHRWRQRLLEAYAGINQAERTRAGVRRTFDASSHAKVAQVNLSGIYGQEFSLGDVIGRAIEGRKRVLDLGCNIGHLTTWYARIDPGRRVTGVDFSPACVQAARRKASKMGLNNVAFETRDVEACDLTGTYDAVVETLCLKYVKDLPTVLQHLTSLLEPGGILLSTTLAARRDDLDALLRSAGLSYLAVPYGTALLIAGKQAEDGSPAGAPRCHPWCEPAMCQVIMVGA